MSDKFVLPGILMGSLGSIPSYAEEPRWPNGSDCCSPRVDDIIKVE